MAEDVLVKYFEDNLSKGYSVEQIRSFLHQQGYDAMRVQTAALQAQKPSLSNGTIQEDTTQNELQTQSQTQIQTQSQTQNNVSSPKPLFEKQGNMFSRSFMLLKASWTVVKKKKSILFFPFLAGIFSLAFITAMIFPSIISKVLSGAEPAATAINYFMIFSVYLGLAFISTFFNVCVVFIAKQELQGKEGVSFGKALGFAFSKIYYIIGWSLVSATVGIIMHLLERLAQKLPLAGYIITMIIQKILGALWSVLSLFAIPAMVIENIGPFTALKHAGQSLRRNWGEGFLMYFSLGGAYFLFIIIGVAIFIPVFIISMGTPIGILAAIAGSFIYFLIGILFFNVINKVFFTALYMYSSTGVIPDGFPPSMMQSAFKPKKAKK